MTENKRYEDFIVFVAPLINSVGGIAIDLYAPSIPSIGNEFGVAAGVMQNTITITLVFYALGQLFFGVMADWKGRRGAAIFGLILFLVGSALAAMSYSIAGLMVARAIQGFAVGSCQVVARALLVDNVKGERFRVAVVYLSLAFGLGPVIAPFIGGKVEEWLGWRWNFALYFAYGMLVLAFVLFGLKESLTSVACKTPRQTILGYREILGDATFVSAVGMLGGSFAAFLMWNVIGPYIVQSHFAKGPSFFGSTALSVGIAYLVGTTLNRSLIKRYSGNSLIKMGLTVSVAGLIVLAIPGTELGLYTTVIGVMLVAFAQGFIFSNAMARSMALFPKRAGAAASLQGCLMLVIGSAASALASSITIESNVTIVAIFATLFAMQCLSYFCLNRAMVSVAR